MRAMVILPLVLLLPILGVATAGAGDYIIFRAVIPPLFIENTTAPIQVMAIYFQADKPQSVELTVRYEITGLNVQYQSRGETALMSGRQVMIYLDPMSKGHYSIKLWAEYKGLKSRIINQDFGVTPPPVPYEAYFTDDGSAFYFRSLLLNETGQPDPEKPFTLNVFLYRTGMGESLVTSFHNVTELNLTIPEEWKTGILIIDIEDAYGWHNGMKIDLSNMIFAGAPIQYDYAYMTREPIASRSWWWGLTALMAIVFLALVYRRIGR